MAIKSGRHISYFTATSFFESDSKLKGNFHFFLNFLKDLDES